MIIYVHIINRKSDLMIHMYSHNYAYAYIMREACVLEMKLLLQEVFFFNYGLEKGRGVKDYYLDSCLKRFTTN